LSNFDAKQPNFIKKYLLREAEGKIKVEGRAVSIWLKDIEIVERRGMGNNQN